MSAPRQYTFSDLTIGEITTLIKRYFVYAFVCLLLFGLPYGLVVGLSKGVESVVSEEEFLWLSKVAMLVLFGWVAVVVFKELPHILKGIGDMFSAWGEAAAKASLRTRLLGLAFVIGYFYTAIKFPTAWFWFTILVFVPCCGVYDEYKKLLRHKAEKEGGPESSTRTA